MLAVACVWRRSKLTRVARCSRMIPTRWIMPAQPSTAAGRASGSSTSPGTRSMDSKQRLGARPHEATHEEAVREERTHHGMAHEARGSCHENALHDTRIVACRQVIFPRAPRAVLAIMGAC